MVPDLGIWEGAVLDAWLAMTVGARQAISLLYRSGDQRPDEP